MERAARPSQVYTTYFPSSHALASRAQAFPSLSDSNIRKRLKEGARFVRGGRGFWLAENIDQLPSEVRTPAALACAPSPGNWCSMSRGPL